MTEGTGSPAALRAGNRARVIGVLREHGEMTQAAMARATGLSPATVSNIVRELRGAGTVDAVRGSAGRRGVPVALRRTAGFAVGIDFGHRHLRVLVADLARAAVAEASRELPVAHTATEGIGQAADMVRSALAEAGAEADAVVGVAMGLPGPVDRRTGAVTSAAIPPGWVGMPAAEQMGPELGLPVRVDNDANLGALAEVMWGAGQDCADLVYLEVATGVRSGFVLGGRIYRGAFGTASEIGHTTIDEVGPVCRCGNRGLEMYAGGGALAALLHRPEPALGPLAGRRRPPAGSTAGIAAPGGCSSDRRPCRRRARRVGRAGAGVGGGDAGVAGVRVLCSNRRHRRHRRRRARPGLGRHRCSAMLTVLMSVPISVPGRLRRTHDCIHRGRPPPVGSAAGAMRSQCRPEPRTPSYHPMEDS